MTEVIAAVDAECRRLEIPMLGPDKAARLVELIRAAQPDVVVEVGTAIGYSGLWIADALRAQGKGKLITLEMNAERAAQAAANFRAAGLEGTITQIVGDARTSIAQVKETIDVLFLDGGFSNYYPCFVQARDSLRAGALLIADNAGIGADEMADYLAWVRQHCQSRTEWFETDLAWNPRDAMEISVYPSS